MKNIKVVTFEEIEYEDLEATDIALLGEKQPIRTNKHFESLDLSTREVKPYVPSIESPSVLKLNFYLYI